MGKPKSWLVFKEVESPGSTKRFNVESKSDGSLLGVVKWHPGYRKYSFFMQSAIYSIEDPRWGTKTFHADIKIFDDVCLDEVSLFIKEQMIAYRKSKEK